MNRNPNHSADYRALAQSPSALGDLTASKGKSQEQLPRLLFTIEQAGYVLALGSWAVRRLVGRGQLGFVKIGRRILISRGQLEEFIRVNSQQQPDVSR
jgi:excisionase family DNA binding protein